MGSRRTVDDVLAPVGTAPLSPDGGTIDGDMLRVDLSLDPGSSDRAGIVLRASDGFTADPATSADGAQGTLVGYDAERGKAFGARPTQPTEPIEPTQPVDPTELADPVQPADPAEPADPADPTEVAGPTAQAAPFGGPGDGDQSQGGSPESSEPPRAGEGLAMTGVDVFAGAAAALVLIISGVSAILVARIRRRRL